MLVRLLEDDGFAILFASDGAAAIALLERGLEPALLITDMQMPGIDGIAVAHFARARFPQLPIVLVTGHPELAPGRVQMLSPSPEIFTKPLNYEALTRTLAHQRERYRHAG